MKKYILLLLVTMFGILGKAQTAVQESKLLDNIYIGLNTGISVPLSMDANANPSLSVRVGKNLTPTFGIVIEGSAYTGTRFANGKTPSPKFIKYTNITVNPTINWNKVLGINNKVEFITVTGLGWIHAYQHHNNCLSTKLALDLSYKYSDTWSIYIEPGVVYNLNTGNEKHLFGYYDQEHTQPVWVIQENSVQFNKVNAQLCLNIGVNYHFKNSNGTHTFKVYDIRKLNEDLNLLRSKFAK